MSANIDPAEQQKFNQVAAGWWDPDGDFRPLHDLNPARLQYISQRAELQGRSVLDVGCGGGLLSEGMAAAGAVVTAIDVAEKPLQVAKLHLHESGLKVNYQLQTAEQHAQEQAAGYAVVACLEMLEHVPDPSSVVQAVADCLEPGGQAFFSTINRTARAFGLAIVGAEYVLGVLPRGTHEYKRFIQPAELGGWVRSAGLTVRDVRGLHYNPLTRSVRVGGNVAVNYLLHASKEVA